MQRWQIELDAVERVFGEKRCVCSSLPLIPFHALLWS